jgi:hypothetical protein
MDLQVQELPVLGDQLLATKIADFLRGIAQSATAIIDNVQSHKVQTDELCVGSVCVTQEQFLQLLQQSRSSNVSTDGGTVTDIASADPTDSTNTADTGDSTSTGTTDDQTDATSTDTDTTTETDTDTQPQPDDSQQTVSEDEPADTETSTDTDTDAAQNTTSADTGTDADATADTSASQT